MSWLESNLCSYLRVVQSEGRRETLGEGLTVSGEPAADRTRQVTVAVQIAWYDVRQKSVSVEAILFYQY